MEIRRGDIYWADLPIDDRSVQGGKRPVLVVQNDVGNKYSQSVLVVTLTTSMKKAGQPTHVVIDGLGRKSIVQCEQVQTVSKSRLGKKMASLGENDMRLINEALMRSLALDIAWP